MELRGVILGTLPRSVDATGDSEAGDAHFGMTRAWPFDRGPISKKEKTRSVSMSL